MYFLLRLVITFGAFAVKASARSLFVASPSGSWHDASSWNDGAVPLPSDEVWMNVAYTRATVTDGDDASSHQLIVGRHKLNVALDVQGGTLRAGEEGRSGGILFVGQYDDSHGTVNLKSGNVIVRGECAVAVSGPGEYHQTGGSAVIYGRLKIGRYDKSSANGLLTLSGGSVLAERFEMNSESSMSLEGGLLLIDDGDVRNSINGLIASGYITGDAAIKVVYDDDADRTRVYAKTNRLYNNCNSVDYASWFDPANWSPQGVPAPGSEVWMNRADTSVSIGPNEFATANKLIVGRHAVNVEIRVDGGELIVGDDDGGSLLFIGQYDDASGLVTLNSGLIRVANELAVGVLGPGQLIQHDGITIVGGRLNVGRYNRAEVVGYLSLGGGEVRANDLQINDFSRIEMRGGEMYLASDVRSKVEDYVLSGKIVSSSPIEVTFDPSEDITRITSNVVVAPPTTSPTDVVTDSPTSSPTENPTQKPTDSPTEKPTSSPTTPSPTESPITSRPTGNPTENPTAVDDPPILFFNNYRGVDYASWFDPSNWSPQGVPAPGSEVWMNRADTSVSIGPNEFATANKLIVGRHAVNVEIRVDGGELIVGDDDGGSLLFIGQYDDASGLVTLNSGLIRVANELAVGVLGPGQLIQHDGITIVGGRLNVGRYNRAEVVGYLSLGGGEVRANDLQINDFSRIEMRGGEMYLASDVRSKVEDYVLSGKIVSSSPIEVTFDPSEDITRITSNVVVAPPTTSPTDVVTDSPTSSPTENPTQKPTDSPTEKPTSSPTTPSPTESPITSRPTGNPTENPTAVDDPPILFFNNYRGVDYASWFDPSNWSPQGVPAPGSEVWMNRADTSVSIGPNEFATANKLIVGRHAVNVEIRVDGGELIVGDDDGGSLLFIGQYDDASGLVTLNSGLIRVANELAVGVLGPGQLIQHDGITIVGGRLNVGRYNRAEVVGYLSLGGGEVRANDLQINDFSRIEMRGGEMYLASDVRSKVEDYVLSGKIVSSSPIEVTFDPSEDITRITSNVVVAPPTTSPTDVVTDSPTSSPTENPTDAVDPNDWDVAGILGLEPNEIGPRLPEIVRNDGTSMEIRPFVPVPPLGVHPRIFFGPDELEGIRVRLLNTQIGQEAYLQAKCQTVLLTEGRAAFEALPDGEKYLPNGNKRISNPGLFTADTMYSELIGGVTTTVAAETDTKRNVLGSSMALEAFHCVVFADQVGVQQRAVDLAAAMATWAQWALDNPDFGPNSRDLLGGQHMAFAYDMNYNAMTEDQRAVVRRAIAAMTWPTSQFVGISTEGYATTTNWVAINSFVPMMLLAIEGDTDKAEDGWSTEEIQSYFRDIMKANYKFLTYGFFPSGTPYEGSGKNYQYNAMFSAYAKRGYNFFTHPNVQAYAKRFLPAQLQPFGHYVTSYDTIGGSGFDPEVGGMRFHANDIIGIKWAYPIDPAIDFAWRQYVETPYVDSQDADAVMIDVADQKVSPRSTYYNALLSLLVMASDFNDEEPDFASQSAAAYNDGPTFNGKERGLVITRSSVSSRDALALNFHIRQDLGGHTFGDRNSFTLSGLGRVWVRNPTGYIPETEWCSGILVNGEGITITNLEGRKARQPGRMASHHDNAMATFTTGDATYAYNNEWYWQPRAPGEDYTSTGWTPVTETWNDFRSLDSQIGDAYGDIPFYDYGHWRYGGLLERIIKRPDNDMKHAYRLAGLVRGDHPYALIVDDLNKLSGGESTEYQWIAQIPEDLTLMPTSSYQGNLNAERDVVLMEPAATGNRRLLVRIINAEGAQPDGLALLREDISYYLWGHDRVAKRLVIKRNASYPRFRVMLFPYREGDEVPRHLVENGNVVAEWSSGQRDTLVFEPYNKNVSGYDVEITGLRIIRDGITLVDTRNEVEPMTAR